MGIRSAPGPVGPWDNPAGPGPVVLHLEQDHVPGQNQTEDPGSSSGSHIQICMSALCLLLVFHVCQLCVIVSISCMSALLLLVFHVCQLCVIVSISCMSALCYCYYFMYVSSVLLLVFHVCQLCVIVTISCMSALCYC